MGYTIAEKILREHVGDGSPERGQEIGMKVDQCLTQDSTGTMAWLEFESLGLDKVKPDTVVSYNDHTSLGFKGESTDDHFFLQSVASKFGAIYSKPGNGVCHQLHYERFGKPGVTMLGSDSHTPTAGGLGMIGIGVGGMDVAVAMAGGFFYMKVPKMMRVTLKGELNWGSSAKDVILELLRMISFKGGVGYIIEYDGPGVKTLTVPERATITNMGAETGATTSIFPSDEVTKKFLEAQGRLEDWKELKADPDAKYDKELEIDLSQIKPLVAMTGMPDNVKDIDEVKGTHIDQVFIGSCTNGGIRDLKIAAEIIKGKKVDPSIDLIVSPGSRNVWEMMLEDGSFDAITKAGGRMIDPGCNACIGIGFVPGHGHLSLRTVNRNWIGRGGTKHGKLALCGAEVAAASALKGEISDPRELPPVDVGPINYKYDDLLFLEPKGPSVSVKRSPNIVPLKPQTKMEQVMEGEALLKVGDGVSTDDILPAGPLTQHLRSNLPEISKFVFYYEDETFAQRALDNKGGFLVGGDNYGQGSSREHAALGPWELGIKAVLANSFARIHRSNLINTGILPIIIDTAEIDQGDKLKVVTNNLEGDTVEVQNLTKGKTMEGKIDLSKREKDMVREGGLLAYTKKMHA